MGGLAKSTDKKRAPTPKGTPRPNNWCCFYCFVKNSLVAFLEALCARILFFRSVNVGFSWHHDFPPSPFFFLRARPLSLTKDFLLPLSTRLLCLVIAIPLVCWLYMPSPFLLCADYTRQCVCVWWKSCHKTPGRKELLRAEPKILEGIWSSESHMRRPKLSWVLMSYRFGRILSIWYGTVHKTSRLMGGNGGHGRQDGPVLNVDSTYGTFWVLESHKLFYLRCGICESWTMVWKSYSHTLTTHMAPPRINFCPGPARCLRQFGTDLIYRASQTSMDSYCKGNLSVNVWTFCLKLR